MLSSRITERIRRIHAGHAVPPLPNLPVASMPSGEVAETDAGRHLVIARPLNIAWPAADKTIAQWQDHMGGPSREYTHQAMQRFAESFPRKILVLDLETCGFAGNAIFLIGLLAWHEGQLMLVQHWARNYAEEASLLAALPAQLNQVETLVTFNGKSFDWPCVQDRFTLHHPRHDAGLPSPTHLDILHVARRRWAGRFEDCKLQTLERHICRRQRSGDIPGSQIPAAYHGYVRHGDAAFAHSVLHHNALDLVTLLQLTLVLSAID